MEKQSIRMIKAIGLLTAILLIGGSNSAFAACSNPAGVTGEQIYNTDFSVMQYCDGTDWTAMRGDGDILSSLTCTDGQIAKWNNGGSVWECAADASGTGGDDLGNHTATQALAMATFKITGLGDPTVAQDAATKAYVDTAVVAGADDLGNHIATTALNLATNKITNLADPTLDQDAATKKYVDDNDGDTVGGLSCSTGQIAKYNGTIWACAADAGASGGDNLGDHTASQALVMATNKITGMGDPTLDQDAATKKYVDDNELDTLSDLTCTDGQIAKWNNGGSVWECAINNGDDNLGDHTATTALIMATNKITGMGDPTADQDAATKKYVDDNELDTLSDLTCTDGQIAKWDNSGSAWICAAAPSGDTLAGLSCNPTEIAKWNGTAWACATDGGVGGGDDLGNHTATQVLRMGANNLLLGTNNLQSIYGNNASALFYDSNSSTTSTIILRDLENDNYGRLEGSGNGVNFGLKDGDNNWSLLAVKDTRTDFAINNINEMRLYPTYLSLESNLISNLADPVGDQDAATKKYVDDEIIAAGGNDNLGNHTATTALNLATNKIINLGTPTAANDATTKTYVDTAVAAAADNLGNHTAAQALAMATFKITGMGDPTLNQDAATKKYVDDEITASGGSDNLGNHTATTALAMATNKITGLGTPTAGTDATTKAYVDAQIVSAAANADTLDTLDSSQFLRSDADDTSLAKLAAVAFCPDGLANCNPQTAEALTATGLGASFIYAGSGAEVDFEDQVNFNNNTILGVKTPTANSHAANKAYVDDEITTAVAAAPGDNMGSGGSGDLITDNTIDSSEIENDTITSADILNNTLTASDIGPNSINASELSDNAVASANIIDGTIIAADLSAALTTALGDANTLDTLNSTQFIRSDALTNVTASTEWQDNQQIRLGTDADFRMFFNGTDTYMRSYSPGSRWILQGEHAGGTNRNMILADPDGAIDLRYAGVTKLLTASNGIAVTGKVTGLTDPTAAQDAATKAYVDSEITTAVAAVPGDNMGSGGSGDLITDNTIDSSEIQDNTLTAADLATDSVGALELANNAVASANIIDGTVTGADILNNTLTASDIGPNAVNVSEIADGAVRTAEILDGTILQADLSAALLAELNEAETLDGINSTQFLRSDADDSTSGNLAFTAASGRGLKFWDSDAYKIYMSQSSDATWGGRLDTTSDYNMYFRMSSGTNRGFVFQNGTTELAQVEGSGDLRTARDIRGGRYVYGSYMNMSHAVATRNTDNVFYSSNDTFIRKNNAAGFRTSLDVYSKAQVNSAITAAPGDNMGSGGSGDLITDNTIDSSEIQDNTLTAADLATDSVGALELANNAVASANIIDSTITTSDILNNTITENDIADNFKARDANLLDGINGASFIRSDADDNVTANTEWQDNMQARFGNDADFRIWHDGGNHVMRSYKHGAAIYIQGENAGGTNRTLIVGDPDAHVAITYAGSEKIRTTTSGIRLPGIAGNAPTR